MVNFDYGVVIVVAQRAVVPVPCTSPYGRKRCSSTKSGGWSLAIPHKTANYPGVSGELSGSELLHHSEMSGRKTS